MNLPPIGENKLLEILKIKYAAQETPSQLFPLLSCPLYQAYFATKLITTLSVLC